MPVIEYGRVKKIVGVAVPATVVCRMRFHWMRMSSGCASAERVKAGPKTTDSVRIHRTCARMGTLPPARKQDIAGSTDHPSPGESARVEVSRRATARGILDGFLRFFFDLRRGRGSFSGVAGDVHHPDISEIA